MFEVFPYTNFHELNLDWIIKIARDFLDQYTNIQQTITTGLEDLDTKAQQLQDALDAWYNEHSEDIAQELTRALTEAISAFNAAADLKASETIASIPDDYTALSNHVNNNSDSIITLNNHYSYVAESIAIDDNDFEIGGLTSQSGELQYLSSTTRVRTKQNFYFQLEKNDLIIFDDYSDIRVYVYYIADADDTLYSSGGWITQEYPCPENGKYYFVISNITETTITDVSELTSHLTIRRFKTAINKINSEIWSGDIVKNPDFWQIGSVSGQFVYTVTNTRCRSYPIYVEKGDLFTFRRETDWTCEAVLYDANFTPIVIVPWHTEIVIPQNGIAVIVARKGGNNPVTITRALIEEMTTYIKYVKNPKNYYYEMFPSLHGIAHKGGRFGPQNNAITYKNAYARGFRYGEVDVAKTSDGVFVCIHDATINNVARMPDGSEIPDTVTVEGSTYAELLEYDFGIAFSPTYAGTHISTLAEVLDVCRKLGMMVYIDFKSASGYSAEDIANIMETVNKCGMRGKVAYIPQTMLYVDYVLDYDPCAAIGLTRSASQYTYIYRCFTGKNAVFFNAQYNTLTDALVDTYTGMMVPVEVYTVDTVQDMEALPQYITGMTSDDICIEEYYRTH